MNDDNYRPVEAPDDVFALLLEAYGEALRTALVRGMLPAGQVARQVEAAVNGWQVRYEAATAHAAPPAEVERLRAALRPILAAWDAEVAACFGCTCPAAATVLRRAWMNEARAALGIGNRFGNAAPATGADGA